MITRKRPCQVRRASWQFPSPAHLVYFCPRDSLASRNSWLLSCTAAGVTDGSYDIVEMDPVELLAEHTHFCEICGKGELVDNMLVAEAPCFIPPPCCL